MTCVLLSAINQILSEIVNKDSKVIYSIILVGSVYDFDFECVNHKFFNVGLGQLSCSVYVCVFVCI